MTNLHLFDTLLSYVPGDPGESGYTFMDKLKEANNWDEKYAQLVLLEYKKFIYLCIVYGGMSPSDAIDQVWHQHILYTKEYEDFCYRLCCGRFMHHQPRTKIILTGEDNTMEYYKKEFGDAPSNIWETSGNYKRIDFNKYYLVPVESKRATIKVFLYQLFNL